MPDTDWLLTPGNAVWFPRKQRGLSSSTQPSQLTQLARLCRRRRNLNPPPLFLERGKALSHVAPSLRSRLVTLVESHRIEAPPDKTTLPSLSLHAPDIRPSLRSPPPMRLLSVTPSLRSRLVNYYKSVFSCSRHEWKHVVSRSRRQRKCKSASSHAHGGSSRSRCFTSGASRK